MTALFVYCQSVFLSSIIVNLSLNEKPYNLEITK